MCGISGVLYADPGRPVDPALLENMGRLLAHRGPDAKGSWSAPGIGLAHRRLSIIDLSTGDQPMSNEDGSIYVVFNGEIYNFRELRSELIRSGHRLRTSSDTEVLLHLYEDHGADFVTRLRGMFAFALWDRSRRTLLLGRDRLGIKPLYLFRGSDVLLFASEPKAFFAYPDIELTVDPLALDQYLAYGVTCGTGSIFRRVEKLPPAHTLQISGANLAASPRRYWSFAPSVDHRLSEDDWRDALTAKLTEAVRLNLIADVPVGAFLSGGLDSSVVVATAARSSDTPVRTFSIGFDDASFSELPQARAVADRYGTVHAEEVITADAVSLLDDLTYFFDEPFADSSAIPTFLVSRLASRSVKVALSGDGGDEAFGGYARYQHDLKEDALRRHLPRWFQHAVLAPAAHGWPRAEWLPRSLRAKTLLTNLSLEPAEAYANTLQTCRLPMRQRLLAPDLRAAVNGHVVGAPILEAYQRLGSTDSLTNMVAADLAVTLPDDYLVKVDRASMANGLEVRPPLLDHELIELTGQMPSNLKIRGATTKWLFRRAFGDLLPDAVARAPKHGFEMPVDRWLRGPLREVFESAVFAKTSPVAGLIDQTYARSLYRSHLAGTSNGGQVLWTLLVLARWSERYLHNAAANLARV